MSAPITRRDFVKTSIRLTAGVGAVAASNSISNAHGSILSPTREAEWRNKQPGMRYRRLGRTGLMISEIVCGGDPIAPNNNRHVEMAIDLGLNYLDTAPAYGNGQSEMGYAGVIQGSKRDRVFINTKVSPFSPTRFDTYRKFFETLDASEQAEMMSQANADIERRHAMVPSYFGNVRLK